MKTSNNKESMNLNVRLLRKIHYGANDFYRSDDDVVSHIGILRSWKDREDPIKLKYCYEYDDDRFYDRLFTIDRFIKECEFLIENECEDSYFTINSFWDSKKRTEDIRHLNAFALDFDFYKKKEYQHLTPEEMYQQHIKFKLTHTPTAVINSGRGLYVIFAFHHCSIARLKLYQAIYKQLLERFKAFGMDAKATHVTQVIRIPGTSNSKALAPVRILEFNDTQYELTDFCHLLPYSYQQCQRHQEKKRERRKEKMEEPKFYATDHRRKICKDLLRDLKTLITLRNHDKVYEGYREQLIYIALERLIWAGYDVEAAITKASKLNNEFHWPLDQRSIEKQCMPTKVHYCCNSISKVIARLGITEKEQTKMVFLCNQQSKDKRKKRRGRKHTLLNRTKKEIELLKRRTYVLKLSKEGKRNIDIAAILEVDKSTITNDLHYIDQHKHEFRKELGETIEALEAHLSNDKTVRTTAYDELKSLIIWAEASVQVLSDP